MFALANGGLASAEDYRTKAGLLARIGVRRF
jgi:hypothetical protein